MTVRQIARVGDQSTGTCPLHAGGQAYTATWSTVHSPTSTADGQYIIRVGDTTLASCGHTLWATIGASGIDDYGAKIHRQGDDCSTLGPSGATTGYTIQGSPNCSAG